MLYRTRVGLKLDVAAVHWKSEWAKEIEVGGSGGRRKDLRCRIEHQVWARGLG